MIKRFHSLYVGQIELENIGLAGTPADQRRYGNDRFAEVFWTAKDVAQEMDALGYYALWTAEHHFQREGYECFPNLIQLSLWLATQTKRLKLGCAFNVLPMWHPIRLAEDYAMADIVTDGRASPVCRGPSTCPSRSGCRSPAASRSTTWRPRSSRR